MKIFGKQVNFGFTSKANPAQADIVEAQGETHYTNYTTISHKRAYEALEVVNRGTNLIADSAADISTDVGDSIGISSTVKNVRKNKLNTLLNFRANPYTSIDVFKRNIFMDLIIEGNAFIYWDGADLYNLPASDVEIVSDKKTFIRSYVYNGSQEFSPSEVMHIRENSSTSIFRGTSRLLSAKDSINILNKMNKYQDNFFNNSAIPGILLKTADTLSPTIKARKIRDWQQQYNPTSGGRTPAILDGGMEIETLSKYSFKELDFAESTKNQEEKILKALGVPPVLLSSGNNANIMPNLKLFYLETVLPLNKKLLSALELFFGYDLKAVHQDIMALRPELADEANYLASLANAGILTRNEARVKIRMPEVTDQEEVADTLILPANIAGSALDAGLGGAPTGGDKNV